MLSRALLFYYIQGNILPEPFLLPQPPYGVFLILIRGTSYFKVKESLSAYLTSQGMHVHLLAFRVMYLLVRLSLHFLGMQQVTSALKEVLFASAMIIIRPIFSLQVIVSVSRKTDVHILFFTFISGLFYLWVIWVSLKKCHDK